MVALLARGLVEACEIADRPKRSLHRACERPRRASNAAFIPPSPTAEAYSVSGELVDVAAIEIRTEYENALARYFEYRNSYETALNSESQARTFFRKFLGQIASERAAVECLEAGYVALTSYEDSELAERFRSIVGKFLMRYSLRYELRGRFSLHATMPGVFAKLMSEVRRVAETDAHLTSLLSEFEESFADLKSDRTQARMKTCLQKQFNLLEALGSRCPNVTGATLGAMCDQLDMPHATIKDIGKKLYGFGSNYPGVRHAGNASGALRRLDMKDLVSLSLMLASFTPYVTHDLDSDRCYGP